MEKAAPTNTRVRHVEYLAALLKQSNSLCIGRRSHDLILQNYRYDYNTFLSNFLIEMYGRLGSLDDAIAVFDRTHSPNLHTWGIMIKVYGLFSRKDDAMNVFNSMPVRDVVSWTTIIGICCQHGHGREALDLFLQMGQHGIVPNNVTLICCLEACTSLSDLASGQEIHINIAKYGFDEDKVVGTSLIIMYYKTGYMEEALKVFDIMNDRDVAAWNAVMTALCHHDQGKEALSYFRMMQTAGINPDKVSYVCVLDACEDIMDGMDVHKLLVFVGLDLDVMVGNALINMYGKHACLDDAYAMFSTMSNQSAVSWNTMITVFADNMHSREAMKFFYQMQLQGFSLDKVSYLGALNACSHPALLEVGHEVHASLVEDGLDLDISLVNTIITMYGLSGRIDDAAVVFENLPWFDLASCNSMMRVLCHANQPESALCLFYLMHLEGCSPNKSLFVSMIDSCAVLGMYEGGLMIHAYMIEMGIDQDLVAENAIVNLYGKSGSLVDAFHMFNKMQDRDVISWTSIIGGFSQNGLTREALILFHKMVVEGYEPDKASFLCILSACNHNGQVDNSKHFYVSLIRDWHVQDNTDYLLCMVDILGRSGRLDEAESLVRCAQDGNAYLAWFCLLSACKIHVDVVRGTHAAKTLFILDKKSPIPYILLSNIYATVGRWSDVATVRNALNNSVTKYEMPETYWYG